jgi:hypothetical protein
MRDPFIQRGPDGTLRMVWTWSRAGTPAAIGYATSNDLLHWTKNRKLDLMASVPGALTATSPATYYDPAKKDWIVLWSSSVASPVGKPNSPPEDRIYATTTTDFKQFAPTRLFFDPGYNVSDATIVTVSATDRQHYLLFEDERANPVEGRIFAAKGPSLDGPWRVIGSSISEGFAQAPAAIPVEDGLLVFYHHYRDPQGYDAALTTDMLHWSDVSLKTSFPAEMRHGSFVQISAEEYNMLHDFYLRFNTGLPPK